MHYTIQRLMQGDESILEGFQRAKSRWEELFSDIDTVSIEDLGQRIATEQYWFEINCGAGRYEGQEVMALSAFALLYTTSAGWDGNEQRAIKLAKAFIASPCSGEVTAHATLTAKSYYLDFEEN
ncbi:hypothetical protein HSX11_02475 [Oxalobacteraceae bacterium]|nr:hypothetical protein [Oxalobacteraceae bacterium]